MQREDSPAIRRGCPALGGEPVTPGATQNEAAGES